MSQTDLFLILCAAIGAAMAFDRHDAGQRAMLAPWAIGLLAIGATATADSVRGFFYLLAMPVGCYGIARMLATPVAIWWKGRR